MDPQLGGSPDFLVSKADMIVFFEVSKPEFISVPLSVKDFKIVSLDELKVFVISSCLSVNPFNIVLSVLSKASLISVALLVKDDKIEVLESLSVVTISAFLSLNVVTISVFLSSNTFIIYNYF
jgi:hypothetical protein